MNNKALATVVLLVLIIDSDCWAGCNIHLNGRASIRQANQQPKDAAIIWDFHQEDGKIFGHYIDPSNFKAANGTIISGTIAGNSAHFVADSDLVVPDNPPNYHPFSEGIYDFTIDGSGNMISGTTRDAYHGYIPYGLTSDSNFCDLPPTPPPQPHKPIP